MRVDFEGRHVVVTGAGGALGGAVAEHLLRAGAICHLPQRGEGSRSPFAGRAGVYESPGVDLADEAAVTRFYAALPALWASIHCAGGFGMAPVDSTSLDDLRAMWTLNAATAFVCAREAVKRLRAGGAGGRIVNVVSRQATDPRAGAGMIAYASSKAALAGLTLALAAEVADAGILVNAVAPGILDTPANRRAMPDADRSAWAPLEEVAATIAFLASPRNTLVRGAILPLF